MDGTAHPFYKWKYEIGQGMSLAGRDWTHISQHKTVGMQDKFQNEIMQFRRQKLHFEESLYSDGLIPLLNPILAL